MREELSVRYCAERCSIRAEFFCCAKIRGKGCSGKMITDKAVAKKKKFEVVYKSHADKLYKFCFYYLKDEEKAKDIAQQAFLNFYKYFEKVTSDAAFKCLGHEAKKLLLNSQHQELAREELEECTMIGKN